MEDVTLRVLRVLEEADVVACEDTRHTRKLLARHGVKARLLSYHEHNERRRSAELVERIRQGQLVALVSDAGMPAVSDPGFVLIRSCIDAGLRIEVLPGPTAVTTALVASGLEVDRWCFEGFLPRKAADLRRLLERRAGDTVVAFESPRRLSKTLKLLAELDAEREVAICRELTKVHEEVVRGGAGEVSTRLSEGPAPKGEVVIVISGREAEAELKRDHPRYVEAVEDLVAAGAKPREATRVVASLAGKGCSANALYSAWVKRK